MADYKEMYYHLAGRVATAVDILEAATSVIQANAKETMQTNDESLMDSIKALIVLKEKLKLAQRKTEEMFIACDDDSDLDLELYKSKKRKN